MLAAFIWSGSAVVFPAPAQVSLPDQLDLARLVDLSAQRLKLRVSYDDQALKGKVTLRQTGSITDAELWALTNRLLAEQGFTTVRAGDDDTMAVVKLASAAQAARVERLSDLLAERAGPRNTTVAPGFRRVLVPIQRASGKDVVAAAQLVLSKPGGVATESEQAGLVMIADLTPYLDVALQLVAQIDGVEGGATLREITAQNVDPTRLATLAKQLADKRKAVGGRDIKGELIPSAGGTTLLLVTPPAFVESWMDIIKAVDQREPVERRTYTVSSFGLKEVSSLIDQTIRNAGPTTAAASGASDDRWKMIQDDLTGTLIITATPLQHEQIAELLERLASIPAESRRPVRTYTIRNRGVKEIQAVIEDMLRAGVISAQSSAHAGSFAEAASQTTTRPNALANVPFGASNLGPIDSANTPPSPPAPAGTAVTSPTPTTSSSSAANSSNTLRRGSGTESALTLTSDEATNTLIAVGEPMVLAQLDRLIPTLDVRQPQVMLEAFLVSLTDNQSMNLGIELEKLQINGSTFIRLASLFGLSTATGSGGTTSRAVGDSQGFSGVVLDPGDFSIVVKALETLNQGRSLSSPKILVVNNQQATFNSVLQQPFASTNASSTVSTTSFGGTQDAGTTISVKPQIAQGDHLALTYSVSLSTFVGAAASANVPPPRQQNSVQSAATIPDGYTVVVGGLEVTTEGESISQIPLVGGIPIVGELFKNRSKTNNRARFFVFIRASILRNRTFEDLRYISENDSAAAQLPADWPDLEPRVIR